MRFAPPPPNGPTAGMKVTIQPGAAQVRFMRYRPTRESDQQTRTGDCRFPPGIVSYWNVSAGGASECGIA